VSAAAKKPHGAKNAVDRRTGAIARQFYNKQVRDVEIFSNRPDSLFRCANPVASSGHRVPFGINGPANLPGKAELASMLPGFRFLFAAIVLSMSVLIFGLGAAALLRAAHEQFASIPSRRTPPEPVFTRQNEPPTLALLRVEPEVAEKVPGNVAGTAILETVTPIAEAPEAPPAEPEKLAALKVEEPAPAERMKAETPAAETTPAIQATPAETPIVNEEVKVAAISETSPPATVATSTAAEPVAEVPSLEGNLAALKIATLGGPAVTVEEMVSAKPAAAKPNRNVNRKRAQRAKERRRIAARRALLARQAAAQQQADPFAPTPARDK
jgi:hypothetical protein